MITKQDFTKKDEFEENYEDLDKLGEVKPFLLIYWTYLTLSRANTGT